MTPFLQTRTLLRLSLLLTLTVPLHATLVVGSEKAVTAPALDVAAFAQDHGRIATDGDTFLAVWIDHTLSGIGDIHGARVASTGKRIDEDVLCIAVTDGDENRVALAFGGNRYLVAWATPTALRARFVGRDGSMSDVIDIATPSNGFALPQIAFDGTRFLIGVTTIEGNGTVAARVVVAPATTPVFDVRALSSGNELLIAWSTALGIPGGTVRAVRITAAGVGEIETIPAEGAYLHDIAFDSAGFLVIYGADAAKYIRRLGASEPFSFVTTPETKTTILDAANNGASTLVLVSGDARVGFRFGPVGGDLYITRLETQEIEPLVVAPRHQSSPDIAAAGLTLSEETANELPAIGSGPEGSLVVWRGGVYLQGALLSRSGTVTRLGFPSTNPVGPRPSVAWNSGTFIVAAPFRGAFGDEIQWLLVSDTGVIRTPVSTFLDIDASIESGTGFPTVDVEAYGDGFLVYWNGVGTDAQLRTANVYAARINREGILADAAKVIGSTVVDHAPSIGATGNLVVYSRKIGHTTRELARVFARDVQYTPGKPRRRAVR